MPYICPLMSDAQNKIHCTDQCALCLKRDGNVTCALNQLVFALDDVLGSLRKANDKQY